MGRGQHDQPCLWLPGAGHCPRSFQTSLESKSQAGLKSSSYHQARPSLCFKVGKKGGPPQSQDKDPAPASPSQEARPQQPGSSPTWLLFPVPPPRDLAGSPIGRQLSMNERSSLAFPAHLLVKQPPGQPHTPTTPPWHVQFPLSCPSLCWVSLPPSLQSGHLLPLHMEGGGRPVTLLLPGMFHQAPLCPLATSGQTHRGKLEASSLHPLV